MVDLGDRLLEPNARPLNAQNNVATNSQAGPTLGGQGFFETNVDEPAPQKLVDTGVRVFTWRRPVKFALFALLFATSLMTLYQQIGVRASREAVINARIAIIRAPLDGVVSEYITTPGSRVTGGMSIGMVENRLADATRLAQLQGEAGDADIERASLEEQLKHLDAARTVAAGQAEAYRVGRERLLDLQTAGARADLAAADERQHNAVNARIRGDALHALGFQSDEAQDKLHSAEQIARQGVISARARAEALSVEREAARNNTFLGDSYNDAPFSLQQARELALRIADTRTRLNDQLRKAAMLREQVADERIRLNTQTEAALRAPVDGQLWTIEAGSGEYARKGDDILTILDCSTVVVTASASARDYNELQLGDHVRFRVSGSDREYLGRIVKFGSSPAYAILPPQGRQQIVVALFDLPANGEDRCAVGRTGEVTFEDIARSFSGRLSGWVSERLRFR
jgi:multidrug resistance efflux pump